MDRTFVVYKHITPSNKVYIGITSVKLNKRWGFGRGYEKNQYFYRAIKKYGWENIEHVVLFSGLTEEEAKQKEIDTIRELNATNPLYGYNKTLGGDYRCKPNEETIAKIKKRLLGQKRTPEQREHYKEGAKKRPKRVHLSEEHKRKISQSLLGNKSAVGNTKNRKVVYQYDFDWNLINVYDSAKHAALLIGCDHAGICTCCRENSMANNLHTKYKGFYKGYRWSYTERWADKLGKVERI